jgi:hypothetical protein
VLYAFGFERVGVVLGDLYFLDDSAPADQRGAERGVRLEVRLFERPPLHGSRYSVQPIELTRPIWRVDLLESVDGPHGTFDRTHHHPEIRGWEVGTRCFDPALSADPIGWVGEQLSDLDGLIAGSEVSSEAVAPTDAADLRAAVPEIQAAIERMLARIREGELATAPVAPDDPLNTRNGWL